MGPGWWSSAPLADVTLVAQTVASVVSVPLAPDADPVSALVNFFRPRQTLVILDNCEHVLASCATLASALLRHCAHLQILATSREALRMSLAELRSGAAASPSLAAHSPDQEPASPWHSRFHLLTSGNRTTVPRQQTLAATIGWSHDLLTDGERRLFRRLSVFAGGWTLDAAEKICAPDASDGGEVLDLLTRLVDKSMVVAEGGASGIGRYRLLETLRQFGQDRLAESGEADAIRDRHFAYYLALVKTAHTEVAVPRRRDGWLARLDDDNDNLRRRSPGAANVTRARRSAWQSI